MIPKVEPTRIGGGSFAGSTARPVRSSGPAPPAKRKGERRQAPVGSQSRRDTAQRSISGVPSRTERTSQDRRTELRMFGAANLASRVRRFVLIAIRGACLGIPT